MTWYHPKLWCHLIPNDDIISWRHCWQLSAWCHPTLAWCPIWETFAFAWMVTWPCDCFGPETFPFLISTANTLSYNHNHNEYFIRSSNYLTSRLRNKNSKITFWNVILNNIAREHMHAFVARFSERKKTGQIVFLCWLRRLYKRYQSVIVVFFV